MRKDCRIPALEKIFAFRGQILLTEKIKGNESCRCTFCYPKGKELTFVDRDIAPEHYQAIKVFVPMSEHKFTKLRLQYKSSWKRKDEYKERLKLDRKVRGEVWSLEEGRRERWTPKEHFVAFRYASAAIFRLYPLHLSVYDEFAKYLYEKFGEPKFGKQNIGDVHWGKSRQDKLFHKKYGTWTHSRTIGVQIYRGRFEFSIDNQLHIVKKEMAEKQRKKNPKIFRKKSGKLV
jgi:hypothetical protein